MNHLETLEREYTQKLEDRTETEPTAADTGNIRLLSEEADLSQYTKLQPASAQADSQKQSEEEDYSGSRLIDGDPATSWQEGEEGTGEGDILSCCETSFCCDRHQGHRRCRPLYHTK